MLQVPGTRWTNLTIRWCKAGGIGHRVTHRHRHAPGILTVFAEVEDASTGMRYHSTYPLRFRIR